MPGVPPGVIAERRLTDRLLRANAVWPGNGQPLDGLRWIERRRLQRLIAAGVIREEGDGRYYLYAPAYAARMSGRRQRIVIIMLFVVAAGLLAALLGSWPAISFR